MTCFLKNYSDGLIKHRYLKKHIQEREDPSRDPRVGAAWHVGGMASSSVAEDGVGEGGGQGQKTWEVGEEVFFLPFFYFLIGYLVFTPFWVNFACL